MGITVPDKRAIVASRMRFISQFVFRSFIERQAKSMSTAKPSEIQRIRLGKNQSEAGLRFTPMSGEKITIGREKKASMGTHPPTVCEMS